MPSLVDRLRIVIRDYLYVVPRLVAAAFDRSPAADLSRSGDSACGRVSVVLLPGIWEPWRFLLPLGRSLASAGHPVHPVEGLGWNGHDLEESTERVCADLLAADRRDVVLVAHSKGGLIGKRVMLDARTRDRVLGMVALSTPFAGSSLSWPVLARSPLGMFAPRGPVISALAKERDINARIVSLGSMWDEMIPQGSDLPGATNMRLEVAGHFLPLAAPSVHALVHRHVDEVAARERT